VYCDRLKYEQDLVVNLEYERGKMTTLCDQEAQQISRLKEVLEIVKQYVLNICKRVKKWQICHLCVIYKQ